ncbi:hypothetical protein ACLOJK_018779, partial [Asimina triloba]
RMGCYRCPSSRISAVEGDPPPLVGSRCHGLVMENDGAAIVEFDLHGRSARSDLELSCSLFTMSLSDLGWVRMQVPYLGANSEDAIKLLPWPISLLISSMAAIDLLLLPEIDLSIADCSTVEIRHGEEGLLDMREKPELMKMPLPTALPVRFEGDGGSAARSGIEMLQPSFCLDRIVRLELTGGGSR